MQRTVWLLDPRPWMLAFLIQVASLHNYFIASSISNPTLAVIGVGAILVCGFYAYFHSPPIQKLAYKTLNSYLLLAFLILLIWIIGFTIYPIKEGLGRNGTGDDAMQQPILAMKHGERPYDVKLFDGVPISPGLGWVLLNAPFTIFNAGSLFNPFYLGLMSLVYIRVRKRKDTANIVLLSIMSCLACVEQFYSYHDLLAIGCAFMIVFLLGEAPMKNMPAALGIGVLSGIVATSRIVFLYVPGLLGLLWFNMRRRPAWLVGISGTATALAIHSIGYLSSKYYQPLHLIQRGSRIPPVLIGVGIAAMGLAAILLLRFCKNSFQSRLSWLSAALMIPLLVIAFGELIQIDFDINNWEAAHYLLPALPAALYAILGTQLLPSEFLDTKFEHPAKPIISNYE